jgi:polyhydroxybutyrate depolymerase
MRKFALGRCAALLSIALLMVACSSHPDAAPQAMTRYTLQHEGLEREYFVFLPSGYDGVEELPVAIFMHGYGGTATGTEAEVTQGLNFYAEQYGYVLVYPQGTWFMAGETADDRWEVTSWNHISDAFDAGPAGPICVHEENPSPCPPECGTCGKCGWTSCNDDVGFLRQLVATVTNDFKIDSDSFFVSGFSNGAMMAHRIACEASELFAAAALIGGRVEPGFECAPEQRLPLLQMNGGADETVPSDGRLSHSGYYFASTTAVTEQWNDGEACGAELRDWSSATVEATTAKCTIACGDTAHPSIDCLWPEGDHRWPGTPGFRGSNGYCVSELQSSSMPEQQICIDPDPKANTWGSTLLFEFFNAHRGS